MTDQDRTELEALRAEVFALRRDVDGMKGTLEAVLQSAPVVSVTTDDPELAAKIQARIDGEVRLVPGSTKAMPCSVQMPATEPEAWRPTLEECGRFNAARDAEHVTLAPTVNDLIAAHRAVFGPMLAALKARAEKAEADRAKLLENAKVVLAVFKPREDPGPDAHAEHAALTNLAGSIAKVEGRQ